MNFEMAESALSALDGRLHAGDVPRLASIRGRFDHVREVLGRVKDAVAEVARNSKLSLAGRRDATQEAIKAAAADLYRTAAVAPIVRGKLDQWQLRIETPPALDKTDAVGAIAQSELRSIVRALKNPGERVTTALADPATLLAVLSAPNIASCITPEQRDVLTAAFVRSDPDRARQAVEIADARDAVSVLESATTIVQQAMSTAGDFQSPAEAGAFLLNAVGDQAAGLQADAARLVDSMRL